MSQQLTLELSDEVYAQLQQQANAVGLSVTDWVMTLLSDRSNDEQQSEPLAPSPENTRQRFKRHAGAIRLDHPTGADNESIDADLARAYANEYEE